MFRSANLTMRWQLGFLHLIAGGLALAYAWLVSGTHYVTSGVQFVSPLAVVLLVHLVWLAIRRELGTGFAMVAFGRMLATAICIVVLTVVCAMYAPIPASAINSDDVNRGLGSIALFFGCLAVLALVISAAALAIYGVLYGIVWGLKSIYERMKGPPTGLSESRLFDASVVSIALLAIGSASLEGLGPALTFATRDGASVTGCRSHSGARLAGNRQGDIAEFPVADDAANNPAARCRPR